MKIEIDLDDILGDEGGVETLQESVRRQVIDALVRATKAGVDATIKTEVAKAVQETLVRELTGRMPSIMDDLLTSEYVPVDRYGVRGKPTSFNAEIVKFIHEQMVYKKCTYDSDKNAFTKSVESLVSEELAAFKKAFDSQVSAKFMADAMTYATSEMAKRLGLSK